MAFQFELDPNSLPKLTANGDNFIAWRSAWLIAFKFAKLEEIVSGKSQRPATEYEQWDYKNTKAQVILLMAVDKELTIHVTTRDTAHQAWTYLTSRFDRDTGSTAIQLFKVLSNLRYHDGENLRAHIDKFNYLWNRLDNRCLSSTHSVAKAIKPIFASDEVKGSFFLATLPDTMDHIVDNLSTWQITTFQDIEPKIMDLAEKHTIEVDSANATRRTPTWLRSDGCPRPEKEMFGHEWFEMRLSEEEEEFMEEDSSTKSFTNGPRILEWLSTIPVPTTRARPPLDD